MQGLTQKEANSFLEQYGQNVIAGRQKKSFFITFFEQFNNFLTILLLVSALLSFVIGEPIDGALIVAIVVLNALFGIYQEAKAEESLAALKKMTVTRVRVIRDGAEKEIDSQFLVPGDICFVEEGVKLAADGVVVERMHLEVNESALTGESFPVVKQVRDEVFSGTIVAKGRGLMKVTATGMKTKFGSIAGQLSSIIETETPLQSKLKDLTRLIGIIGIVAALAVFVITLMQGGGYFPAFLLAISLAVAVVPEGLPAVMTITLAIGVREMSHKKAVVRKLAAIEGLGSVTLIATDKTGTLTTNKMHVKEIYVDGNMYSQDNLPHPENHPFRLLVRDGIVCSTASLVYVHDHGSWDVLGDPTEGALLYLGQETGTEPDDIRKTWKVVEEIPFDSVTKKMSVMVQNGPDRLVFAKGAPEVILASCDRIQTGLTLNPLTDEERRKTEHIMHAWARKGLRVLGFSYIPASKTLIDQSQPQIFLGMVAIHDAPRPEVNGAVARAHGASIKVVMITGDNEKTAEAIGVTAGIIKEGDEILTGTQLDEYSDQELLQILPRVKIFARTSPFQKHRIVSLYQKLGEVVAVTGDGVNDSIALKQADIGVAMGLVGTDVARETADMVITDDNFASIVTAVGEGRNIIQNMRNAIQYLLTCNVSEALSLIVGLMFGFTNLLYPLQLLYINLVTDGVPALSLAFSPRNPHLMKQHPARELALLKSQEKRFIFIVGLLSTVLVLVGYVLFRGIGGEGMGRAAAFSILTLTQSFVYVDLWLSHQSLHTHVKQLVSPLFVASFLFPFVTQFFIVTMPFLAKIFGIPAVGAGTYGLFVVLSACVFVIIKLTKKLIHI